MSHSIPLSSAAHSRFSYVTVPGLNDSGPDHWQTWAEQVIGDVSRIRLNDWSAPNLNAWLNAIDAVVMTQWKPAILIAHSFGALAAAQYAIEEPTRVAGVLLVAPADPARFVDAQHLALAPVPSAGFLVASRNDPWMEMRVAQRWAQIWRLNLIDAGEAGHINVASGHGAWPAALTYLARLNYVARGQDAGRIGSIYRPHERRSDRAG